MDNLFVIATRKKYRFPFRGQISIEDLWDLDAIELDVIYKALTKEQNARNEGESLLSVDKPDKDLENKIEIVKFVFATKDAEAKEAQDAIKRAKKKEQIMAIVARKENDSLEQMSKDDLMKMIDELG